MPQITEVKANVNIKSPFLQKMYRDAVGNIAKVVMASVAEEVGSVIEALEEAVTEAFRQVKGGAQ